MPPYGHNSNSPIMNLESQIIVLVSNVDNKQFVVIANNLAFNYY